jgi:hypothetical protein
LKLRFLSIGKKRWRVAFGEVFYIPLQKPQGTRLTHRLLMILYSAPGALAVNLSDLDLTGQTAFWADVSASLV